MSSAELEKWVWFDGFKIRYSVQLDECGFCVLSELFDLRGKRIERMLAHRNLGGYELAKSLLDLRAAAAGDLAYPRDRVFTWEADNAPPKGSLVFLMTPYSDNDPNIVHQRYMGAMGACEFLLNSGYFVYSPIVHSHPLAGAFSGKADYAGWHKQSETMLKRCDCGVIGMFPAWQYSKGIEGERVFNKELGHAEYYLRPEPIEPAAEMRRSEFLKNVMGLKNDAQQDASRPSDGSD